MRTSHTVQRISSHTYQVVSQHFLASTEKKKKDATFLQHENYYRPPATFQAPSLRVGLECTFSKRVPLLLKGFLRDEKILTPSIQKAQIYMGLPQRLRGKESTCNAGDLGSILGSGSSPGQWLSHVLLFVTLWTVACQGPLSMEFPRREYWRGLPLPSPTVEAKSFITGHKVMHNQPILLLNSLILSSTPFPLVHSVPARLGFLIFQERARHTSFLGLLHQPFPLFGPLFDHMADPFTSFHSWLKCHHFIRTSWVILFNTMKCPSSTFPIPFISFFFHFFKMPSYLLTYHVVIFLLDRI